MEDVLDELCSQLPEQEYARISQEIWQEKQKNWQTWEAARRFTVFCLCEHGESAYYSVEDQMEMLQLAAHLRKCLSDKNAGGRFAAAFFRCEKITQEQFDAAVTEHMENTGRVSGVYALDFDKKTFSELDNEAAWKTYEMKDVSTAAYFAKRKAQLPMQERTSIFRNKLNGKEMPYEPPAMELQM